METVGGALASPNIVVRDFAIGYFERVRPRGGLIYLLPLLDAPEDLIRTRIVTLLEHYGAAAVSAGTCAGLVLKVKASWPSAANSGSPESRQEKAQ